MELPSKILEQKAFNSRLKTEEHMLIVMEKSTHEEHLAQILQTTKKQFKIAITFLRGCNGIFNVTDKIRKFLFAKSISDEDGFIQITIPPGADEIESLNNEIKRINIDEKQYTEAKHRFTIKPIFSNLRSIIEISTQGLIISFVPGDSIQDLLGFNKTTICEEYILSPNLIDILSFDKIFLECDNPQGMIFKCRRSGIIHNLSKDVDPGYKYFENFRGGVQWYLMESKHNISSICFKMKIKMEI